MTTRRFRLDFRAMGHLARAADYTIPFVLRAICRLGVADHLGVGARSIEDLAVACQAHTPSLLRAMRALVMHGVFAEPAPGFFALTPQGDLLRSDHPDRKSVV